MTSERAPLAWWKCNCPKYNCHSIGAMEKCSSCGDKEPSFPTISTPLSKDAFKEFLGQQFDKVYLHSDSEQICIDRVMEFLEKQGMKWLPKGNGTVIVGSLDCGHCGRTFSDELEIESHLRSCNPQLKEKCECECHDADAEEIVTCSCSCNRKRRHLHLPKNDKTYLSSCCGDRGGFCVSVGSDEGTWHYDCSLCHNPCDISETPRVDGCVCGESWDLNSTHYKDKPCVRDERGLTKKEAEFMQERVSDQFGEGLNPSRDYYTKEEIKPLVAFICSVFDNEFLAPKVGDLRKRFL